MVDEYFELDAMDNLDEAEMGRKRIEQSEYEHDAFIEQGLGLMALDGKSDQMLHEVTT